MYFHLFKKKKLLQLDKKLFSKILSKQIYDVLWNKNTMGT